MATLTTLHFAADGTLNTTSLAHDAGTGTPWYTHCNDDPDSSSSDYVTCNGGLADGSYDAWFALEDVNADFGSMTTFQIRVDVQASGFANDTCNLVAQVFDGNESTNALSDEQVVGSQADTTRTQRDVSFGSLVGSESEWNSAHVRLRWVYDRITSADGSSSLRIYGCDFDGTYTVATVVKQLGLLGVG